MQAHVLRRDIISKNQHHGRLDFFHAFDHGEVYQSGSSKEFKTVSTTEKTAQLKAHQLEQAKDLAIELRCSKPKSLSQKLKRDEIVVALLGVHARDYGLV